MPSLESEFEQSRHLLFICASNMLQTSRDRRNSLFMSSVGWALAPIWQEVLRGVYEAFQHVVADPVSIGNSAPTSLDVCFELPALPRR